MPEKRFGTPLDEAAYIHNQGMSAWRAGHIEEALSLFKKALAKKEIFVSAQASTIHMIGIIYAQKRDWDNATRYFLKSLKIDADDRHFDGVAISLNDIAVMCKKRGDPMANLAIAELANLVLEHGRGGKQINQEAARKLLEKVPPELSIGIQEALKPLMR